MSVQGRASFWQWLRYATVRLVVIAVSLTVIVCCGWVTGW